MKRRLVLIAGVVAFLSVAQGAPAFTTRPVDPLTTNDRLADPDQLADRMSNRQSGENSFAVPGGHLTLQSTGRSSGDAPSSPFLASPGTAFVPSEHR
jgi:hypothetical protein